MFHLHVGRSIHLAGKRKAALTSDLQAAGKMGQCTQHFGVFSLAGNGRFSLNLLDELDAETPFVRPDDLPSDQNVISILIRYGEGDDLAWTESVGRVNEGSR